MIRTVHIASFAAAFALLSIVGTGTFVRNGSEAPVSSAEPSAAPKMTVDPAAKAREIWESRIPAYVDKKAVEFRTLRSAIAADPYAAGARYGHRSAGVDARFSFVTSLHGKVLSSALDDVVPQFAIDVDGDGKADAIVQCGPVFADASLRDALDFISFATFDNQIAYGEFGTALDDLVYSTVTRDHCRGATPGRPVTILGTFTRDTSATLPTLTPVRLAWESK